MKRTIVTVLIAMTVWVGAVVAQGGYMVGAIDLPAVNGAGYAEVGYGSFYVAGWALDCDTGARPTNVFVEMKLLSTPPPDGVQHWVPDEVTVAGPIYRPDVAAAFVSSCPLVTDLSTGYALYVSPQPPQGLWLLQITWSNSSQTSTVQERIVEIY
jgi:hypothetical protein